MNGISRRAMLRTGVLSAAVAGASLMFGLAPALAAPVVGQPAPEFVALDSKGQQHKLADFKGKVVVLEWTNHECPFVKKHYESGNIPTLQKDAADKGIVWLQVVSSAPGKQGHVDGATAQKLNGARKAAPAGTVLDPDGSIGKLYGAQTTPHIFIVKPDGTLAYKGGIDSIATADKADLPKAENYVTSALKAIAAGTAVEKASTKPYGCAVKYG